MARRLSFLKPFLLVLAIAAILLGSASGRADGVSRCPVFAAPCAFAQPLDVGVLVEKPTGDGRMVAHGSGVFLGRGLVLTAAHVVKADPGHPSAVVHMDGLDWPAEVVFIDAGADVDLAVVKIAPQILLASREAQRGVAICAYNPGKNQPAVVISQGVVTRTATLPIDTKSVPGQGPWTHMLAVGLHPGNSGGGVFDPSQGCLWGIVVQEVSGHIGPDQHFVDFTAFTGASAIWAFLSRYKG